MKGEKTGMKGGGFVDDKRFSTSTDFEHLLPQAMKEGKLPSIKMLSVSIRGWIIMEWWANEDLVARSRPLFSMGFRRFRPLESPPIPTVIFASITTSSLHHT